MNRSFLSGIIYSSLLATMPAMAQTPTELIWHAATFGGLCGSTPAQAGPGVYKCESPVQLNIDANADCAWGSANCNASTSLVSAADLQRNFTEDAHWVDVKYSATIGTPLPPNRDAMRGFGVDLEWNADWKALFSGALTTAAVSVEDVQLDHVQGVGRLARDDGAWMVVSRSDFDVVGKAGFWVVKLDATMYNGFIANSNEGKNLGKVAAFYRMPDTVHPGSLQVIGNYVVIAKECTGSYSCGGRGGVEIWDLTNPLAGWRVRDIRFDSGTTTLPGSPARLSSVAAAQLNDGRYLFMVGGRATQELYFFITREPRIDSDWVLVQYLKVSESTTGIKETWADWQNFTLVSTPLGGLVAVAATGNALNTTWQAFRAFRRGNSNPSYFELYSLSSPTSTGGVALATHWFQPYGESVYFETDDYCSARGGAGAYVNNDGSLVLYCHSDITDSTDELKLRQLTAKRAQ